MVTKGTGKALVCAVGRYTRLARNQTQEDLKIKEQDTHLEQRLAQISGEITKYAIVVTALIVAVKMLFFIMLMLFSEKLDVFSNETLVELSKTAIIAITVIIVAIPEGLPLAVSIAMALSITNLKNEEILIKNLEGVQNCAMLHNVCVSKSGTITKEQMNVLGYHITTN